MPQVVSMMQTEQGGSQPDKRWRVLVVDDSPTTALLIQQELSARCFEVLTAEAVDEATRTILNKHTRPDLVLLDVMMPDVDGQCYCRFLKGNEIFKGIKVVLCSSKVEAELREVARSCGADGYVLKSQILGKWLVDELSTGQHAEACHPEPGV
jgi:CheY-like chemotaxis protein